MLAELELVADLADREFRGRSFNGNSLMETVRGLSAVEAASTDSYEGYSAWTVLAHCVYYKYYLLRFMGCSAPLEPYPWREDSFPGISDRGEGAWEAAMAYAVKVHESFIALLGEMDREGLGRTLPAWDCTVKDAVVWLASHDAVHNGQIRNMGIAKLRRPLVSS